MPRKIPKDRCRGTTTAGKRCKVAPLSDSDFCRAHDPKLPDKSRFGSPQQAARAGASPKPHVPGLLEAMRQRVEERTDEILTPYFQALTAVHFAKFKGEVLPSSVPDPTSRIEAAERLLDRVYGKPKRQTEFAGAEGPPIPVEVSDAMLHDPGVRDAARVLRARIARSRSPSYRDE